MIIDILRTDSLSSKTCVFLSPSATSRRSLLLGSLHPLSKGKRSFRSSNGETGCSQISTNLPKPTSWILPSALYPKAREASGGSNGENRSHTYLHQPAEANRKDLLVVRFYHHFPRHARSLCSLRNLFTVRRHARTFPGGQSRPASWRGW